MCNGQALLFQMFGKNAGGAPEGEMKGLCERRKRGPANRDVSPAGNERTKQPEASDCNAKLQRRKAHQSGQGSVLHTLLPSTQFGAAR